MRYLAAVLLLCSSIVQAATGLAIVSRDAACAGKAVNASSCAQNYDVPRETDLVRVSPANRADWSSSAYVWKAFGQLKNGDQFEGCATDIPAGSALTPTGAPCKSWPFLAKVSATGYKASIAAGTWTLRYGPANLATDLVSESACASAAETLQLERKYSCVTASTVTVAKLAPPVVIPPTPADPVPPVVDPQPPVTGAGIKYHPSHYAWVDTVKSSQATINRQLQEMDEVAQTPGTGGILLGLYWGDMEGARGDYSRGFAILDQFVKRAEKNNQHVMVRIYDRIFGGIEPANLGNGYYFPAYLKSSEFDGGWYTLNASTALHTMVKMWNPAVMDRMIAMMQAYGARYDSHPNVEMIGLEETGANAAVRNGGYTDAAYIAQLKRWMIASRAAWPHTGLRLQLNYFISAYQESADLARVANQYQIAMGGPDTVPASSGDTGLDYGDLAFNGKLGGIDYRGKIPRVAEVQDYSLSHGFTLPAIQSRAVELGANYIVWSKNGYSKLQWSRDIAPFIRSINGAVASKSCPTSYPSCLN